MKYSELSEKDIKYLLSLTNGERTIDILKMRDQGKTLREIANVINRSASTVNVAIKRAENVVIKRAEHRMQLVRQKGGYPSTISIPDLKSRQFNCLKNAGILDNKLTDEQMRQKIKTAIECGELDEHGYNGIKIKNYARKSFCALLEVAGLKYYDIPDKIKTKKQSARKKYITVALSAETHRALVELSKKEGRNLAQTTRSIIEAKFIK